MRLITEIIHMKRAGTLTAVGKANFGLIDDPSTLRIVITKEFKELAKALWPEDQGYDYMPHFIPSYSSYLAQSPEFHCDWKAVWLEYDYPHNNAQAVWHVFNTDYKDYLNVYVSRDHNGFLRITNRSQEHVWEGWEDNDGTYKTTDNARTLNYDLRLIAGVIRAINVLPDEFKREVRTGIGPVEPADPNKRKGPKRPLPELTTIYLRAGRRESDGTISATDRKGQRWHQVRGHFWTPHTKTEKQWRRTHWRGDPSLGVTTPIYKA